MIGNISARQREILRLLGHVRMGTATTIGEVIGTTPWAVSRVTIASDLRQLHEQRLLWCKRVGGVDTGHRQLAHALWYGLSHEGKAIVGEYADDTYAKSILARDGRGRFALPYSFRHDCFVATWCSSVITGLLRVPACQRVLALQEFRTTPEQRIDAIIVADFNFYERTLNVHDEIPWIEDWKPPYSSEHRCIWMLEFDNNTEARRILAAKYTMYDKLHREGVYRQLFRVDPLLTLVVPTWKRFDSLSTVFLKEFPALVSAWQPEGIWAGGGTALEGRYYDLSTPYDDMPAMPLLCAPKRTGGKLSGYHIIRELPPDLAVPRPIAWE